MKGKNRGGGFFYPGSYTHCTMSVLCLETIIPISASLLFELFTVLFLGGSGLGGKEIPLEHGGCKTVMHCWVVESLHYWREFVSVCVCMHALAEDHYHCCCCWWSDLLLLQPPWVIVVRFGVDDSRTEGLVFVGCGRFEHLSQSFFSYVITIHFWGRAYSFFRFRWNIPWDLKVGDLCLELYILLLKDGTGIGICAVRSLLFYACIYIHLIPILYGVSSSTHISHIIIIIYLLNSINHSPHYLYFSLVRRT